MKTTVEKMHPSALIARSCPDTSELTDPRAFAWEILRRRADYQGVPAAIDWLGTAIAPLELIRPLKATNKWGLRFRRRP